MYYEEKDFKYLTRRMKDRYDMVKYMTALVPIIKPASCDVVWPEINVDDAKNVETEELNKLYLLFAEIVHCARTNKEIGVLPDNMHVRADAIRAMDFLARSINDEPICVNYWLSDGVADGDVDGTETDEDLDYYTEEDNFVEMTILFVKCMNAARRDGIYVDNVTFWDENHPANKKEAEEKGGEN